MATFKASLLMQLTTNPDKLATAAQRLAGWSESWYRDGTSPQQIFGAATNLARKRALLLPVSGEVIGIRVQQVNPVGASQSFPAFYPGLSVQTDIPQMTLLCRAITSNGLNARQVKVTAIPDARVVNGEYSPSQAFANTLQDYFAEVINNWQISGIDRSQPVTPFLQVGADGVLSFATAHGITLPARLRFFRSVDVNGRPIKGTFQVAQINTTTSLTLSGWKGQIAVNGRVRKIIPIYPPLTLGTVEIQRVITRKVGKSFFQYRGRASARK